MDVPEAVETELDGERVVAHVPLKGEDAVFATPTRILVYGSEGLLSDEFVASYSLTAERIELSEGRRKSTVSLDYGLDGTETFTVPSSRVDAVLDTLLAGVLNARDVVRDDETVEQVYRFSELTLVVVSDRLVKHVGTAVWNVDYEEIPFESVRDVDVEEGSVASQLVLTTDRRIERIKVPSDQFRAVREAVEDALFAFHGVRTSEEFRREVGLDEDEREGETDVRSGVETEAGATEREVDASGVEHRAESNDDGFRESALEPIGSSTAGEDSGTDETAGTTDASTVEPEPEPELESESASEPKRASTADSRTEPSGETHSESPTASTDSVGGGVESGLDDEAPLDREALRAELDALHETVQRQQELLERQREQIESLLDVTRDR
ncbi:DUF7115 domain-containing protein [Halospeciosus flavus]|uniref:DUF7115 domain-containing protein n=1 Tax=Halospeciosus flavus TaxID=3032283 RepID=A0ABD5Z915_9EURY|nr:hypothetical protein [Halospeciosus flavus]